MTLVAAFPLRGIPVLVGDFLLTDNQVNKAHDSLSTRPGIQKTKSNVNFRRIAGLRKKIHKINDRLVVGFTGDLLPCEILIKALVREFSTKEPTKKDLDSFLSGISIPNKHKIKLVGWYCDNRPLCFEWNGVDKEIKIVDYTYSGSGGKHFYEEIMPSDASGISDAFNVELERATYIAVAQVGKILLSELMAAKNLHYAYGFGGELVLWDGARFSYVDKIAYAFWNILINEDNSFQYALSPIQAVYKNFDTYSVMQISHIGPNASNTGYEAKNTDYHLLTPLNDSMLTFDSSKIKRISYDAPIWFTGVSVFNPKKSLQAVLKIVSDGTEENRSVTFFKNGRINIDMAQIKERLPLDILN
ncbi:MAG TPA: hypothetical protein VK498_13790 [Ferruginibacter sp.]|nr:hypothetical protein [Ferruginibacter sp.]